MERRFDRWALLVLLGFGIAYQAVLFREGVGLIDEGHLANGARRLAAGEILYRDVYTVYPPASFQLVAWLFDLFGVSLLVVRAFHVAMTLALAVIVFVASRRWMETPFALLAAALVAGTGWHVILEGCHYAHLYGAVPMAALLLLARADERGSIGRGALFGLGVLSALALAFRLAPAVGLGLAGTAVLLARSGLGSKLFGQLAWIALGVSAVVVPIGFFYAMQGALGDLLLAVFWTSFGQYLEGGEFNLPMPGFELWPGEWSRRGIRRWFVSWEFRIPLVLYLAALFEFARAQWHRRRSRSAEPLAPATLERLALALFGAVLYLRATGRSDYYHLAPVLFPAYVLGADWLARGWRRWAPARTAWIAHPLVLLALVASLGIHEFDRALRRHRDSGDKLEIMPGGPLVARSQALDDLIADLRRRTAPGEPIVVLPWYPIVYFLADRPNPTRFDWLFPGYLTTDAEVAEFIDEIDRSPARVAVYSPVSIDALPDRSLAAFAPEIDRFLKRRFAPVKRYGQFWVMTRRSAPETEVRAAPPGERPPRSGAPALEESAGT
ncbi:MAG: hypothetical protein R3F21_17485 [Myxococcota bacterium]